MMHAWTYGPMQWVWGKSRCDAAEENPLNGGEATELGLPVLDAVNMIIEAHCIEDAK